MNIAFFDFDGTISHKDSLFVFMKFLLGRRNFYLGLVRNVHYLLAYSLGLLSNSKAKEKLIKTFLKGFSQEELEKRSKDFLPLLQNLIKSSAQKRIQWHQSRGDEVVVVSATFEVYLLPWCEMMGIKCIATKLEQTDGYLSGRFATPNCYGKEKVRRIRADYLLENYQEIYAYGDSQGDLEMLEIANFKFYRVFKSEER